MSQQVVSAPIARPAKARSRSFDVPTSGWARARERLAWFLVAPSVLVVLVVAIYPLFQSFRLSFTNARFGSTKPERYVGFDNYRRLWHDTDFHNALWHTIQFTVASVALETVAGIVVALIINSNFQGR